MQGKVRGLAVADGVLAVSTDAGHIYAFSARTRTDAPGQSPAPKQAPFAEDHLTQLYQTTAREILKHSGQTRGFCLVVGSEHGRLAYELAKQSELTVYGVESDAAQVTAGLQMSRDGPRVLRQLTR